MRYRASYSVAAILLLPVGEALASPMAIGRDAFSDLETGRSVVTEDFESFTLGPQNSPLAMANGVVSMADPFVADVGDARVLYSACCWLDFMTLTGFPDGTIAWGASMRDVFPSGSNYDIKVVGGSGTEVFSDLDFMSTPGFIGVYDETGILEVQIRGNHLDAIPRLFDIQTISIPEPHGLVLAIVACVCSIACLAVRFMRNARRS